MITYIVSCMVIMLVLLVIGHYNKSEAKKEAEKKLKEIYNTDIEKIWLIAVLTSSVLVPLVAIIKVIRLIRFLCNIVDKEDKK